MGKHRLVYPGGELSAGADKTVAIQSVTLTQCVNSGTQLTPGSVCAALLQVTLIAPQNPGLAAGDAITLYEDTDCLGTFYLTEISSPTPGRLRLTGYDSICQLDRDLTAWLDAYGNFPCTALIFVRDVCEACGLEFTGDFTNSAAQVDAFRGSYTGRRLLSFAAQIAGGFCRATPSGQVEIGGYADADVTVAEGDRLSLESGGYEVARIDAVSLNGVTGENGYAITGNPLAKHADLDAMRAQLPYGYVPCSFETWERRDIACGDRITLTQNGKSFQTLVMEKVDSGGRSRFRCTGTRKRSEALYSQTAMELVQGQTQQDVWNTLTEHGSLQGIYLQDGKLYINAELVQIVNLVAQVLESRQDTAALRIDGATIQLRQEGNPVFEVNTQAGGRPIVYLNDWEDGALVNCGELTAHHLRLGGSGVTGQFTIDINQAGQPRLKLPDGTPRRLYWKQTDDGYALCGA